MSSAASDKNPHAGAEVHEQNLTEAGSAPRVHIVAPTVAPYLQSAKVVPSLHPPVAHSNFVVFNGGDADLQAPNMIGPDLQAPDNGDDDCNQTSTLNTDRIEVPLQESGSLSQ